MCSLFLAERMNLLGTAISECVLLSCSPSEFLTNGHTVFDHKPAKKKLSAKRQLSLCFE
jgi:hypothetical protein